MTKDSAVVKTFVRLVREGKRTVESIKDDKIRQLVIEALKDKNS